MNGSQYNIFYRFFSVVLCICLLVPILIQPLNSFAFEKGDSPGPGEYPDENWVYSDWLKFLDGLMEYSAVGVGVSFDKQTGQLMLSSEGALILSAALTKAGFGTSYSDLQDFVANSSSEEKQAVAQYFQENYYITTDGKAHISEDLLKEFRKYVSSQMTYALVPTVAVSDLQFSENINKYINDLTKSSPDGSIAEVTYYAGTGGSSYYVVVRGTYTLEDYYLGIYSANNSNPANDPEYLSFLDKNGVAMASAFTNLLFTDAFNDWGLGHAFNKDDYSMYSPGYTAIYNGGNQSSQPGWYNHPAFRIVGSPNSWDYGNSWLVSSSQMYVPIFINYKAYFDYMSGVAPVYKFDSGYQVGDVEVNVNVDMDELYKRIQKSIESIDTMNPTDIQNAINASVSGYLEEISSGIDDVNDNLQQTNNLLLTNNNLLQQILDELKSGFNWMKTELALLIIGEYSDDLLKDAEDKFDEVYQLVDQLFPFALIVDFVDILKIFDVEPVAPVIPIRFDFAGNYPVSFDINFYYMGTYIELLKGFIYLMFLVSLISISIKIVGDLGD